MLYSEKFEQYLNLKIGARKVKKKLCNNANQCVENEVKIVGM